MKACFFGISTMLLCGHFAEAGNRFVLRESGPWESSLSSFSLERAHLYPLFQKARERYPAVAESELTPRVEMNVKYIFHNRLNRERLLVAPSPESMIGQIRTILELNDELHRLTGNGRELLMRDPPPERYGELVDKVGEIAGELKSSFEAFFLEGASSSYILEFPKVESISAQFVHFILQSEKINRDLTERLDEFFFGSSPGAVALSDYERSSILVLSESLCKLSQLAEREIADSGRSR